MEFQITAPKTYRYFIKGNIETANKIIFVLHGYGQLANYFINKFNELSDDYLVVAPEGMHRFYLKGSNGRVGASWMTKEAREFDILDNIAWLNQLSANLNIEKFDRVIILGFSQGGATAARWSNQFSVKHELILWASVFPPDIEIENVNNQSKSHTKHFILGLEDEYFNDEQKNETLNFYKNKDFNTHTFNGKHTIDQKQLIEILS